MEAGRRRDGVEQHGVRRRPAHGLHRHGKRHPVDSRYPLARRRGQPLPLVNHRAPSRHGAHEVVLPNDSGRQLGLHGHAGHRARRNGGRRRTAQGLDASSQERILLRDRPSRRHVAPGPSVRSDDVGYACRHGYRETGREPGRRLGKGAAVDAAGQHRSAQLGADGLRCGEGLGVHPDSRHAVLFRVARGLREDRGLHAAGAHDEPRYRQGSVSQQAGRGGGRSAGSQGFPQGFRSAHR